MDELKSIGLSCEVLNTNEVYGVFYSALRPFTKEYISKYYLEWNNSIVGLMEDKKYEPMYGKTFMHPSSLRYASVMERLLDTIYGTQQLIKNENSYVSEKDAKLVEYIVNDFQELIDALEGELKKENED